MKRKIQEVNDEEVEEKEWKKITKIIDYLLPLKGKYRRKS